MASTGLGANWQTSLFWEVVVVSVKLVMVLLVVVQLKVNMIAVVSWPVYLRRWVFTLEDLCYK